MQAALFGFGNRIHDRVDWPYELFHVAATLPPSFIPLLASNSPPSSSDIDIINNFKAPILDKISEFDAQQDAILDKINDLNDEMLRVRAARRPFDKQVAACKIITSPFRRLPDDILHEIVKHCPVTEDAKTHFPSQLARVCRSWRRVVMNTSSLWKDVQLEWPRHTDAMDQFNHFTRLSRSLPLSLRLDERVVKVPDLDEAQGALPFLKSIALDGATFQRLECLDIFSPRHLQMLDVLKVNKLPLLKFYMQIQTTDHLVSEDGSDEEFEALSINELLKNAPQLAHLWFGTADSYMGPLLSLPLHGLGHWSQLTTLHFFGSLYVDEWHTLLKFCTHLERAWVRVSAPDDTEFNTPDLSLLHTHTHFKELIIQLVGYAHEILLPFAGFRFARLKSLQVGFIRTNFLAVPTPAQLQPVDFADVFPSLENLVLMSTNGVEDRFDEVFPLLLVAPTTRSLLTNFCGKYYLEFLEFLRSPQEDGQFPLPALQELEIEFSPSPANNWSNDGEQKLTDSLFKTCTLRSSKTASETRTENSAPPKSALRNMIVRYNPGTMNDSSGITGETKRRMTLYFHNLEYQVDTMNVPIEMKVRSFTAGHRTFASPVMRDFMHTFAFWRFSV